MIANEKQAPRTGIRLLCWFGVYFAAQLPLIPCIHAWVGPNPSPWIWFIFPTGLAWWLFMLMPLSNEFFVIALMVIPWIGYIFHLVYSLRVRERRHFLILMWTLGAIVIFNLGSCASFLHDPPQ